MRPSVNKNSERESNPMPYPLYLYLFGSAFLVRFADPNKQIFNVKSIFKFLNNGLNVQEIYIFITFLGTQILFTKQYQLKFMSGNT